MLTHAVSFVSSGETLTVKASGSLSKKVKKGSKVFVEVKYGLIRLLTQELDLCNEIKNVDITCPLDKGRMTIAKEVKLPKEIPPVCYICSVFVVMLPCFARSLPIPPSETVLVTVAKSSPSLFSGLQGRYTVLADAYDQDDERLTCLRATVMFHPRRPGFWW